MQEGTVKSIGIHTLKCKYHTERTKNQEFRNQVLRRYRFLFFLSAIKFIHSYAQGVLNQVPSYACNYKDPTARDEVTSNT